MAEVLGILTGAAAVLQQCISLFITIKTAVNGMKDLPEVIDGYTKELRRIKDLVDLIEGEEALQTLAVGAAVEQVQGTGGKLKARLELMQKQSETSKVEQIVRNLISGSVNDSRIKRIMKEMAVVKLALITNVLVVNVGLSQGVKNTLQVNTATLKRVDDLLQEKLGDDAQPLKLADRVKGRATDENGAVTLNSDDIKFLRENTPAVDISTSVALSPKVESLRARKVIRGNLATDYAWMQNVPVNGMDEWKDLDVFIENNTANDDSVMMNYPVPQSTLLEMFRIKAQSRSGQNTQT